MAVLMGSGPRHRNTADDLPEHDAAETTRTAIATTILTLTVARRRPLEHPSTTDRTSPQSTSKSYSHTVGGDYHTSHRTSQPTRTAAQPIDSTAPSAVTGRPPHRATYIDGAALGGWRAAQDKGRQNRRPDRPALAVSVLLASSGPWPAQPGTRDRTMRSSSKAASRRPRREMGYSVWLGAQSAHVHWEEALQRLVPLAVSAGQASDIDGPRRAATPNRGYGGADPRHPG